MSRYIFRSVTFLQTIGALARYGLRRGGEGSPFGMVSVSSNGSLIHGDVLKRDFRFHPCQSSDGPDRV